jgi:23S rRNA-/tRNA-specific pseudouridylate synthase
LKVDPNTKSAVFEFYMLDKQGVLLANVPFGDGVEVIHSNEDGLLAVNKPTGVLSHPNEESAAEDLSRSLLKASYDFEEECYYWETATGELSKVWLLNRLDSATSGVILMALDAEVAQLVKGQFSTHHVDKVYFAIVRDLVKPTVGEWEDSLKKNVYKDTKKAKGFVQVSAKTRYHVNLRPTGSLKLCLLKLMPLTGRTHQLRVQCAKHGHPIVGDRTYGSFSFNREIKSATEVKRMMLHSGETTVRYSYKGKAKEFKAEAPLPEVFRKLLRYRESSSSQVMAKRPTRKHGPKPNPAKAQLEKFMKQRRARR